MAKKIKLQHFNKEIQNILSVYSDEVIHETKDVVDEVTAEALKMVKQNAPVDKRNVKRKGKYKRSLKKKTLYESITEKRNVIFASGDEYRLAHLLEKGHAKSGGGRVEGHPHFKYGDELVKQELPDKLKKAIEKI